jgi:hypothetical protein
MTAQTGALAHQYCSTVRAVDAVLQKVSIGSLVTECKGGTLLATTDARGTAVVTEEVSLMTEDTLAVRIAG